MKKLRVLVLMDESLVPPETLAGATEAEILEWKTEFDVCATLDELGHSPGLRKKHEVGPMVTIDLYTFGNARPG